MRYLVQTLSRLSQRTGGFAAPLSQSSYPPPAAAAAVAAVATRALGTDLSYVPIPGDSQMKTVTLIPGDGIGPEVVKCVERVVETLKAPIKFEKFEVSGANPDGTPRESLPDEVIESVSLFFHFFCFFILWKQQHQHRH